MTKTYFVGHGQGTSMQPIINEGDKLFVEKVGLKDIRVGTIVVSYNKKNLIGHRVIKIAGQKIITKGDNTPVFDKPLKASEILGKVVRIDGKYGQVYLNNKFSNLLTFYFLFYSLTTYYLPLWLRSILVKVLRGRKILVKLLTVANFSNKYPNQITILSR